MDFDWSPHLSRDRGSKSIKGTSIYIIFHLKNAMVTQDAYSPNNTGTSASPGRGRGGITRRQGTYWLGTLPSASGWIPCLPTGISYLKGQEEEGEGGFLHFQLFFILSGKKSLAQVRQIWEPIRGHWELTRSSAAEQYVWKEISRVGEPFEFGVRPIRRNSSADWAVVKQSAIEGKLGEIPPDLFVRYYRSLCSIAADHAQPVAMERVCYVFWGPTGSGKSRRAWHEAGIGAYSKDPRSKFWCGYRDQENIVFDEFRGGIDISHMLRWLDRYPVTVEIKGGSRPLMAKKIWITSNIHPSEWYPVLDAATSSALLRRMEIIEIN